MKKYLFITQILMSILLPMLMISSCSTKKVEVTNGIPLKIVIGDKNGVPIYDSNDLNTYKSSAKQWDTFFIVSQSEKSYEVTHDIKDIKNTFYIKKTKDTINWNTYFALAYKNSPHSTTPRRERVGYYRTIKGLKAKDREERIKIEKFKHPEKTMPSDHHDIILKSLEDNILYTVGMYDDVINNEYVFQGNYSAGYMSLSDDANFICRYINKIDLQDHLRRVLRAETTLSGNVTPERKDDAYRDLSELIAKGISDVKDGAIDISKIFDGSSVPQKARKGIFSPAAISGKDIKESSGKLEVMQTKMVSFLNKKANWNEYNYSCIPAEWMESK